MRIPCALVLALVAALLPAPAQAAVPSVAIRDPNNPSVVNPTVAGAISIEATVTGNAPVRQVSVDVRGPITDYSVTLAGAGAGTENRLQATQGGGKYYWNTSASRLTFSTDTTIWPNSSYFFTIFVSFTNGEATNGNWTFRVDNPNPIITHTAFPDRGGRGTLPRGQFILTASALANPRSNSTIAYVGISGGGVATDYVLVGQGAAGIEGRRFGPHTPMFAWATVKNSLTIVIDTRRWDSGTNPITLFVEDSGGRVNVSSPILLDLTDPITTTLRCSLPGTVRIGSGLSVKCSSSERLTATKVAVQTLRSGTWTTLKELRVTGTTFSLPLSSAKTGTISVRAVLAGTPNVIESATSNTATVRVVPLKKNKTNQSG